MKREAQGPVQTERFDCVCFYFIKYYERSTHRRGKVNLVAYLFTRLHPTQFVFCMLKIVSTLIKNKLTRR